MFECRDSFPLFKNLQVQPERTNKVTTLMNLFTRRSLNQASIMLALLFQRESSKPITTSETESSYSSPSGKTAIGQPLSCPPPESLCRFYAPPSSDVRYEDNITVFGSILRGELPARTFLETKDLVVFEDIAPRAPLHALAIPKRYIRSVFDLEQHHLPLLLEMKEQATKLIAETHPKAFRNGDYVLCFHVPPFNSVDHIHLHILAPASQMGPFYRYIKYNTRTRWCTDIDTVVTRLRNNQTPVPYKRPY